MLRIGSKTPLPSGSTTIDTMYIGPHDRVGVRYRRSYTHKDGFTYRLGVPEAASTDVYCDRWRTTDLRKHRMVRYKDIPREILEIFITSVYKNLM